MASHARLFAILSLIPITWVPAQAEDDTVPVDLVICLDTSGSMTDLIDSARGRLWDIITELAKAQPTPRLRVGCLTFGTPETSTIEDGWVVKQVDLTTDLDTVYAKLMALDTSGGDEFVGRVLHEAVENMSWSEHPGALRLIYVAGNESANQGAEHYDFRYVGERANGKDIVINPIYAGPHGRGIVEQWEDVATHGGGAFAAIDAQEGTVQIATPFDATLDALNRELNGTYVPYGQAGAAGLANLVAQDRNARKMGAQSCGSRVAAKGCGLYDNAAWDLIDAARKDGFDVSQLARADLPAELRPLSVTQRQQYIAGMRTVRDAIQARIQEVGNSREAFLRAERAKRSRGQLSLDDAMLKSLRAQASVKGFAFPTRTAQPGSLIVQEPTVGDSPTAPRFNPPVQENIDALLASLPAVQFGAGSYVSTMEEHARLFAGKTGQSITYRVGEMSFSNLQAAQQRVVESLQAQARMLQTIREFEIADSPFPFKNASINAPGLTKSSLAFQVGGINFPTRATAEQVMVLVKEALEAHRKAPGCAAHVPETVVRTALTASERTELTASIRQLITEIRIIAEAADAGYMRFVDGC